MIRILEIKETLTNSELVTNMYKVEKLIKDIIKQLEMDNELNVEDYNFINLIFEKHRIALQKVYNIIKE